jgi:hypothetical protein
MPQWESRYEVELHISEPNLRKEREAATGNASSCNHTADCNHSKTSILKFCHFVGLLLFGVCGVKTDWVETKVTCGSIIFVHVGECWECACFQEGDPSEDLDHRFWKSIMGIDNLRDSFERELLSRNTHELRNNESNSGQHCSTPMLQFGLTEPWKPFRGTLVIFATREIRDHSSNQAKQSSRKETYLGEAAWIKVDRSPL